MVREMLGEFELRVLLAAMRLDPDGYSVPIALELEERTGKTADSWNRGFNPEPMGRKVAHGVTTR